MPPPPAAPPPQTFPYDYLFKVLIIGDASVGKASLRNRMFHDAFEACAFRNIDHVLIGFRLSYFPR